MSIGCSQPTAKRAATPLGYAHRQRSVWSKPTLFDYSFWLYFWFFLVRCLLAIQFWMMES